jgi:hypothetical protein
MLLTSYNVYCKLWFSPKCWLTIFNIIRRQTHTTTVHICRENLKYHHGFLVLQRTSYFLQIDDKAYLDPNRTTIELL